MTSRSETVISKKKCNVDIALGDDSKFKAAQKGKSKFKSHTQYGVRTINLSDTLVSKILAMTMLSVPALLEKMIGVLFLPGKALFIYFEDEMKILGTAAQAEDGLFYISDQQKKCPTCWKPTLTRQER